MVALPTHPHTGEGLGPKSAAPGASLIDTCAQSVFTALLFTVINPDVRLCRATYDELARVAFDAAEAFVDESRRRHT